MQKKWVVYQFETDTLPRPPEFRSAFPVGRRRHHVLAVLRQLDESAAAGVQRACRRDQARDVPIIDLNSVDCARRGPALRPAPSDSSSATIRFRFMERPPLAGCSAAVQIRCANIDNC